MPLSYDVEKEKSLRLLAIGNSHTNDTTWLLHEVFRKEMPQVKAVISALYYSGCTVAKHLEFGAENTPAYEYYKNDTGVWNMRPQSTLDYGIADEPWDIVMLHEMNCNTINPDTYKEPNIQKLKDYVTARTEKTPEFMWNLSWANPVDKAFFAPDHIPPVPTEFWVPAYEKSSGLNYTTMFTQVVDMTQKHVLPNVAFSAMTPTGTAICYARNVLNQSELDLYRDYTHQNDFGRLISAYVWYAVLTGKTEITGVNVDVIPAELRQPRAKKLGLGDMEITDEMKQVIVESVNYALKNPLTVPTV